ncbi:hypothetical protein [Haloarchaeobius iranensis]|uniref:Proteasome lid subunit RPN8/RPN11, contains Jab1/MPN metalloenzyme (JAMM) motif n=1 Tax=Haloarchaeobius iranensis TaxID=996166 RepID=A0A1G9UMT8_9EURY|nr:hypothetical protein [Haloarchaeobius iranensis]SDM61181.1 hypothetical protein SAMN05192554_104215 [Haloarchaeobius iranensis]
MVYLTRGLLETLLDFAREADPEDVTVSLAATAAGDLDGAEGLSPETPVLTDFYLPDAGGSVSAVFGVDLSTPPGQTHGRFVSHATGELAVSREDDLHAVVFVAVPPWGLENVRAFDRSGRRQEMHVVDAVPPEGSLD